MPRLLAGASGALFGAADGAFERGDRQPLADAGTFIDALVFARLERDLFDHFAQIVGNIDFARRIAADPRFLLRDGHAFGDGRGIVRANFAPMRSFSGVMILPRAV